MFRAGENEVYRVEADGGPDLLLPALREFIRSIDIEAGRMTVATRRRRCAEHAPHRRGDPVSRALRPATAHVGHRPRHGARHRGGGPLTTCASTGSAAIGRSTTTPTAGERGWSCARSRCRRRCSRCARPGAHVILLDPAGERLTDALARELAAAGHLALVCGRYEGIDERARALADREVSIGDYVLTGGELPALVLIDAVARLVPGVIEEASTEADSFAAGLLEHPQYTRPEQFGDEGVPPVLLSGNHGEVDRWRRRESLRRTLERRPDLLERAPLSDEDRRIWTSCAPEAEAVAASDEAGYTPPVAAEPSVAFFTPRPRRPDAAQDRPISRG